MTRCSSRRVAARRPGREPERLQEQRRAEAVLLGVVEGQAVLDDLVDRDHRHAVLGREALEVGEARRRAVVAAAPRRSPRPGGARRAGRGRRRPRCGRAARARRRRAPGAGTRDRAARSRSRHAPGSSTLRIVSARSAAPMPLPAVTWSIDTVNAVSQPARSDGTIGQKSSSSRRSDTHGMHTRPRAHRSMKLIASGVTQLAAIVRSPSFSRSSSSTTSTISPRRMRFRASSIVASAMGELLEWLGRVTTMRQPCGSRRSGWMSPPWRSTIHCAIARPRPAPPSLAARAESAR